MHPIVPYARSAYASGWAASGGPMTDRVKAGCVAAIQFAIEHADEPGVIEATLKLGSLEGTWAAIFQRRDELHDQMAQVVLDAWKTFVTRGGLDIKAIVSAVRRHAGLNEAKLDKTTAEFAAAIILSQLMNIMSNTDWSKLDQAVTTAINSGLAEGQTSAMALLADKIGATNFNWDQAFADAQVQYANNPYLASVNGWISTLMEAVAKAAGKRVAQSVADGDNWDGTEDATNDAITNPQDSSNFIVQQILGLAISAGILWWFRGNGVANIWFITAGDDRVCPECDGAEASSPYYITDVPQPPLHGRCRCTLYSDDPLSGDLIAQYLGD